MPLTYCTRSTSESGSRGGSGAHHRRRWPSARTPAAMKTARAPAMMVRRVRIDTRLGRGLAGAGSLTGEIDVEEASVVVGRVVHAVVALVAGRDDPAGAARLRAGGLHGVLAVEAAGLLGQQAFAVLED